MKTTDFIVKKVKSQPVVESTVCEPEVELVMPEFAFEAAELQFNELLGEDASAGASSAGCVSAVVSPLGKGPKDIIRRQQNYTNQLSKGGTVKVKK